MRQSPTLSEYKWVGEALKVSPLLVRALARQESNERGFDHQGRITIRFEPHVFKRSTVNAYKSSLEYIKAAEASGLACDGARLRVARLARLYGAYSKDTSFENVWSRDGQWELVDMATGLMPEEAADATSWGLFQIMGFNAYLCGFSEGDSQGIRMRQGFSSGIEAQMKGFVRFCLHPKNAGLLAALREMDFARIAYLYNGPAYARNRYDVKLSQHVQNLGKDKAYA